MSRQRTPERHASTSTQTSTPQSVAPEAPAVGLESNAAAQEELQSAAGAATDSGRGSAAAAPPPSSPAGAPSDPMGAATGGGGSPLPYQEQLEAALGQPLGHIGVHLGQTEPMARLGANAAARGTEIAFAETSPSLELVAQEVVHVVQAGGAGVQGTDVSRPSDAAEGEAKAIAARIAGGGEAGPVRQAASASVMRDETPPAETAPANREVTRGEFTIVAHPDTERGVRRAPDREGKWHCTEAQLDAFAGHLAEMATLRTEVLAVAGRGSRNANFARDLGVALRGKTVEARTYLRVDPVFLRDPSFQTDPQALVRIANVTSPASLLGETMQNARTRGVQGPDLLAMIRAFAQEHPAEAQQVVMNPGSALTGLTEAQRLEATAYLANGGAEHTALTRVRIAMESRNAADFQSAFDEVAADAATLDALRNDATFLSNVRNRLGDGVHATVQQRMLAGQAVDNSDLGLSEDERRLVTAAAATAVRTLHGEFNPTFYTSDANVLSALETYFAAVNSAIVAVTNDEARRSKVEEARTLLKTLYRDTYRGSIAGGIRHGLDSDNATRALAMIREVAGDAAAAIAEGRERAAGAGQEEGPPLHITDQEIQLINPALQTAITAIKRQDDAIWLSDQAVISAMEAYRTEVNRLIVPATPGDVAHENAARRRRNEGILRLDDAYEDRYGKTVTDVITSRLGRSQSNTAHAIFEDARLIQDDAAEDADYGVGPGGALSDAEQGRVLGAARARAQSINQVVSQWIVGDTALHGRIRDARAAMRELVSPTSAGHEGPVTGQVRIAWEAKTTAAMQIVQREYDALYGSLVGHIHRYLQTDGLRNECLRWLGTAGGGLDGAVDQVLGGLEAAGVEAEQQEVFGRLLESLRAEMTQLAQQFSDELDNSVVVRDAIVIGYTRTYTGLKGRFSGLVGITPDFTDRSFIQYLEQAYLPIGGSLRQDIVAGLDQDAAETAFSNLDLGSVTQATTRIDENGLTPAEIEAGRELHEPGRRLFNRLEGVRHYSASQWSSHIGESGARLVAGSLQAYKDAASDVSAGFLDEFYLREHYMRLGEHVGSIVPESRRDGLTAILPGIALGPYRGAAPEDPDQASREAIEAARSEDPEQVPADLRFDPLRCSPGFSLEQATNRARDLHAHLNLPLGTQDNARLTRMLTGDNGSREENRIVNAMYVRMYGVTVQFDLHRVMRYRDQAEAASFEEMAETAGQSTDFAAEIMADVRVGTDHALNQIYSKVLMGTAADKSALLGDPTVFSAIRARWGQRAMDRVYRSATGEITLADLIRTRDESTEWYTFGFGTDEEGAREDVKLFFTMLKRQLGVGLRTATDADGNALTSAQRAAALDAAVKARARELLADPAVREILDAEFSGAELLEIEQLIAGGGEQSATAQAEHAVTAGEADALLTQIRAMSAAERTASRGDPVFLDRVRRALSASQRAEAMALLFAGEGADQFASLEAALTAPAHTSGGTSGALPSADSGGRDAIFEAVLGMDTDGLAALANDPIRVARIRTALRMNAPDLALFEQLIGGVTVTIDGSEQALRGAADLGAGSERAAGEAMSDADRARIQSGLTVRHIVAVSRAARQGEDPMYAAAQAVFVEKGETVVRADPEQKADLFGDVQRRQVWAGVQAEVAREADFDASRHRTREDNVEYFSVKDAILGVRDLTDRRLSRGFDYWDNDEAIDGAIDNASDDYVANSMSNIANPGPGNTSSMGLVYARFSNARAERDLARANLQLAGPDERAAQQAALDRAEQNLLIHHHAFRDFRLDVADLFALTLSQSDRDHMDRREDINNSVGSVLVATGDARYFALVNKVRGRVLGLSQGVIARALDIPTASLDPSDAASPSVAEQYRQEDLGELMTDDRKERSRASHAVDTYMQQRGQGSLANLGSADEGVDLEYARYMGEVGAAVEGDLATGTVGSIDEDEVDAIGDRREAFDGAIAEYEAAKAALRDVMKWIAIAVITAIATALTGPGGPTLMAAMITAAAQAGTIAVINEATMGRDYEFWQEGMRSVVVDTATAAVTFGLSRGMEHAVRQSPFLQAGADKLARFRAWETGLEEGASQSLAGAGAYVLYSGGRASLTTAMDEFQGAVVDSIDPSQWKYGWHQGMTFTRRNFDARVDGLGGNMLEAFWTTMVTEGAGLLRGQLLPEPPKEEGALSGVDVGESAEEHRVSLLQGMRDSFSDQFGGRELAESGFDYTVEFLVDRGKDGDWSFDSDDIGSFMGGYLQERAEGFITGTGEQMQEQRNARDAARLFTELRERFDTSANLHGLPPEAAREHFQHFLGHGVRDHARALEEWQTSWNDVDRRLRARIREAGDLYERSFYREWVLSDPAKIQERLTFSAEAAARAHTSAEEQRIRIQNSREFQALSQQQQQFYMAYMMSPERVSMTGSRARVDMIDVREGDGRTRFVAAYAATKRAVVLNHAQSVLAQATAAERTAFNTMLQQVDADRGLPEIDPERTGQSEQHVQAWAQRWLSEHRRAAHAGGPASHGSE